jgi:arginyl-tRNA synthetase
MLVDWEAGQAGSHGLVEKMNAWVYEGFEETYKGLVLTSTKLITKVKPICWPQFVEQGLQSGVFFKKEDGSVWDRPDGRRPDENLVPLS